MINEFMLSAEELLSHWGYGKGFMVMKTLQSILGISIHGPCIHTQSTKWHSCSYLKARSFLRDYGLPKGNILKIQARKRLPFQPPALDSVPVPLTSNIAISFCKEKKKHWADDNHTISLGALCEFPVIFSEPGGRRSARNPTDLHWVNCSL